jgi:GTP-binding protein
VIDVAASEDRDPIDDFKVLLSELKAYRENLIERPILIALNKADQEDSPFHIEEFKKALPERRDQIIVTSGLSGLGIDTLKKAVRDLASS